MNKAERVLLSGLITELDEAGFESSTVERLRRLIAAQEATRRPAKRKRYRGDPPALIAAKQTVHERSNGICEARIENVCEYDATEVHHRAGRTGPDCHHPNLLMHVCGHGNLTGCHGIIEQNPDWARRHGMKLYAGTPPESANMPHPGCPLTCQETHEP